MLRSLSDNDLSTAANDSLASALFSAPVKRISQTTIVPTANDEIRTTNDESERRFTNDVGRGRPFSIFCGSV